MEIVEILENLKITDNSYIISFKREINFIPGQVIGIFHGIYNTRRIYSIASGNKEENIRILYKINPHGLITPLLARLKKGDKLKISEPFGSFGVKKEKGICIATGTGIAPFASMYFSGMLDNKLLLHGSRTYNEFYFQQDLLNLSNNYIRCCSEEDIQGCFHGRVTNYVDEVLPINTNINYYLCGKAEMVVEMRDKLIDRGVSFNRIFAEIYF